MEILGGIVLSILALVLLGLVGLTTVFALSFMAILGLLTDMSFKRLFFVSYAMALAAPILLVAAGYAAVEDGSLERDLRRDLGQIVDVPEDAGPGDWRAAIPKLQDLRDDIENGDLSEEEIEQRIEDLFDGTDSITIDVSDDEEANEGETVRVQID